MAMAMPARTELPKLLVPVGSLFLVCAVLVRRTLRAKMESQTSPRKQKKPKRRAKRAEELEFAPPLEPAFAAECYAARKAASSMTASISTWLQLHAKRVMGNATAPPLVSAELSSLPSLSGLAAAAVDAAAAAKPVVFSVLSVGCGDGELDLELIAACNAALAETATGPGLVPRLHYVGLEPNRVDAAHFRARIQAAELPAETVAYVLEEAFEAKLPKPPAEHEQLEPGALELLEELEPPATPAAPPPTPTPRQQQQHGAAADGAGSFRSKSQFDLVMVANVLPYFRDLHGTLQRLLSHTRNGGRLLLINPGTKGAAELQVEQMRVVKGSETHMCQPDEIKRLLSQLRLQYQLSVVESRLNATECLARSATGLQILSHCLESDVRRLCERKMMKLLKVCWRLTEIEEDGMAFFEESAAIFIVEKPHGKK
mmetsp:Transcript_12046/g.27927  ORF Transcript_12046/g.27927 Transcript_12046/m.27927 type:complete len:429 (-) Transcript_12046:350-1636(-)